MLFGIVSPTRPLLMTLMVAFDLSLKSSRRNTSGYVAADLSAQSPTVEDDQRGTTPDNPTSIAAPMDAIPAARDSIPVFPQTTGRFSLDNPWRQPFAKYQIN